MIVANFSISFYLMLRFANFFGERIYSWVLVQIYPIFIFSPAICFYLSIFCILEFFFSRFPEDPFLNFHRLINVSGFIWTFQVLNITFQCRKTAKQTLLIFCFPSIINYATADLIYSLL